MFFNNENDIKTYISIDFKFLWYSIECICIRATNVFIILKCICLKLYGHTKCVREFLKIFQFIVLLL